jgi:glycosyltransferase involved in cell wall biosynthesis
MKMPGSKKNILMVFPYLPYPLRANGISVRYLPVIKYLSERHTVDIILLANDAEALEDVAGLKNYCNKLMIVRRAKPNKNLMNRLMIHSLSLLPWTPPCRFIEYGGEIIPNEIEAKVNGSHYDTLVWVSPRSSPYLFPTLNLINVDRVVMDFIDSPTMLADREYKNSSNYIFKGRYECWKTRKWEARITNEVDAAIYISEVDAATIPQKSVNGSNRYVINNGLNVDLYNPDLKTELPSPNIGFLGHMNYPPNIEAVHWLYDNVFIPLRNKIPELNLIIIGRSPAHSVIEMGKNKGVMVTGTVDDIWPYVNSVNIFVFPIWMGGGIKNKVIEAMYAKRPVITTKIGNEGINALSNKHLIICGEKEKFCNNIELLLKSKNRRDELGNAAHEFVKEKFLWENILNKFEDIIAK